MNLHGPDSPFRAELQAQYDKRPFMGHDVFYNENCETKEAKQRITLLIELD